MLFSGDHVLPRISPSVAVHVQQPVNPLADFLDALRAVRDLDVDEVLPAHQWRFRGLDARVDELLEHHRTRLDETCAAISASPGLTCWETTLRLRWSRDWSQIVGYMRRAAVGETLAHLVLLESSGRVRRDDSRARFTGTRRRSVRPLTAPGRGDRDQVTLTAAGEQRHRNQHEGDRGDPSSRGDHQRGQGDAQRDSERRAPCSEARRPHRRAAAEPRTWSRRCSRRRTAPGRRRRPPARPRSDRPASPGPRAAPCPPRSGACRRRSAPGTRSCPGSRRRTGPPPRVPPGAR